MKLNRDSWEELLTKAKQGNHTAQNEAAMWLEEGYQDEDFKIDFDLKKAAHWYLASAKLGNSYSQDAISRLYSTGQGIELDYEKAIEWANQSINQGNSTAAHNLATVYRDLGEPEKAFEYYSLSLKLGNNSAH